MQKLATAVSTAGVLIASTVLCSSVARADPPEPTKPADPTDTSFLHALDEDHVTYGDAAGTIDYAKRLCGSLRAGVPATQLISQVKSANPNLTQQGADYFVAAAMAHYCRDQIPPGH